MREFIAAAKALTDMSRVRALLALRDQELCVCELVELLQLAPSTVSKHMAILAQAQLVQSRKEGRWVYYRRADGNVPAATRDALLWIDSSLSSDPVVQEDTERLKEILRVLAGGRCGTEEKG